MARVRFPLPAPRFSLYKYADVNAFVAQLVEHTLGKGEVGSSNLLMSSIFLVLPEATSCSIFVCVFLLTV